MWEGFKRGLGYGRKSFSVDFTKSQTLSSHPPVEGKVLAKKEALTDAWESASPDTPRPGVPPQLDDESDHRHPEEHIPPNHGSAQHE